MRTTLFLLMALMAFPAAAETGGWREAPRRWLAAVTPDAARLPPGRVEFAAAIEAGGEALALAGARLAWGEGAPWLSGHAELAPRRPALADLALLRWRLDTRAAVGAIEIAQETQGRLWDALPGGAALAELARAARR
jgi:hypothetical protein